MKKLILTIAILASAIVADAYDFYVVTNSQNIYLNIVSDNNGNPCAEVVAPPSGSYSGNIIVPYRVSYDGQTYDVAYIGRRAFFNAHNLISVTLLDGALKGIKDEAFYLARLEEITIPSSVTSIGERAFGYHPSASGGATVETFFFSQLLKTVTINSESLLTSGKKVASMFGYAVEKYIIGEGVTAIGASAFSKGDYDAEMTTVILPKSLETIGYQAFSKNRKLEKVFVPNDSRLVSIGEGAFGTCDNISEIFIPESVRSVGDYALYDMKGLQRVVDKSSAQMPIYLFGMGASYSNISVYISSKDKVGWYEKRGCGNVYLIGNGGNADEDVNHDGTVNSLDVLKVYKYMQSH